MERALIAVVVLMGAILIAPIWWLGKAFFVTSEITLHQIVFWCILVFVPIALVQMHRSKRIPWHMHWKLAIPLWVAYFFVYYTTGLFYFSGIADKSIINAQAVGGVWEESYTSIRTETVCDSKNDKGDCTSSHTESHCDDYHPDSFTILFSDGSSHSINRSNYRALVGQLKNEKQESVFHFGQCSVGDGRKFATTFAPGKSSELYVSYEIPVVNYILAGRNLYKTSDEVSKPYLSHLQTMPGIGEHPTGIGPWKSNRLLLASVAAPDAWKQATENELNKINGMLGPSKEVNVVMYLVGTADKSFSPALESYWTHGKKNQLTIIVGTTNFPKVDWVDVISFWSVKPEVGINIRDRLEKMSLDDPGLVSMIAKEVQTNWQRKHMEAFKHLAWDLTIPWWAYLLVTSFSIFVSLFFSRAIPGLLKSM
jgi:hypothetical protein